jgi:dihydrofolate synthase / folylpolyglutamate synthase
MIGNPQDDLKCVHIAGTNGKGSVSFMIASILKESRFKTGLYTSPSIMDFRERIQTNGKMIPKKKICELIKFFEPFLKSREFINDPVTEFELTTAMAFKYFSDEKCDISVIETGMGGKLDATNVIKNPLCCAVTSVSLDHTEILGNTIEKIAKEKFGIIKSGYPVVLGPCMDDSVCKIAESTALNLKSPIFTAQTQEIQNIKYSLTDGTSFMYKNMSLNTPMLGKHQVTNMATVFKIIDVIGQKLSISPKAIKIGLKKTHVPCRFEVLSHSPLIILDGAHNPAGAETLVSAIKTYLKRKKLIGIIGMFKDKDVNGVISKSVRFFSKIITVEPQSKRALSLSEITKAVKAYNPTVLPCQSVSDAIELAVSQSDSRSAIVIFGSFSIMKEARNFIKNSIIG